MQITGLEPIAWMGIGSVITWGTRYFLRKTLGTNYRTQKQCDDCSVRAAMVVIRSLIVELAIKAGVPPHEVAKVVTKIGSGQSSED